MAYEQVNIMVPYDRTSIGKNSDESQAVLPIPEE